MKKDVTARYRAALENVVDAYPDFVTGMLGFLRRFPDKQEAMIAWMKEHPEAQTDDVMIYAENVVYPDFLDEDEDEEDGEDDAD